MKRIVHIILLMLFLVPVTVQGQIKNPDIPRSWWSGLKTFIVESAELTFSYNNRSRSFAKGSLEIDTVAVFTPAYDMTVTSVDFWLNSIGDPDSTLYLVFAQSSKDTVITIDSSGNGFTNYWQSNASFTLTRAIPCSVFIYLGKNSAETGNGVITIHGRNK